MADMVPIGVDRLTGEGRPVLDTDQITTPSGTPLTGGKPTPAQYGVNTLLMTGDLVLVDTSEVIQSLDPNGADRSVTLPVFSINTPFFRISNTAPAVTTFALFLRNSAGVTIAVIEPATSVVLYHNGTEASLDIQAGVVSPSSQDSGFVLGFGGDYANNMRPNGDPASIDIPSIGDQYHIVPVDCQLKHVYSYQLNNGTNNLDIYKAGAVGGESLVGTAALSTSGVNYQSYTFDPPIAFSAGDVVRADAQTDRGAQQYQLVFVSNTVGLCATWGANSWSAGQFAPMNSDRDNSNSSALNGGKEAVVVGGATSLRMALHSGGSITSQTFKIWKNGVEAESLVVTTTSYAGISGVNGWTGIPVTAVAEGDRIAIESDTASIFNGVLVSMAFIASTVQGVCYPAGKQYNLSQTTAINPFYTAEAQTSTTHENPDFLLFRAGSARIAYKHTTAPDADHNLYKNGVLSEAINMQALTGTVNATTSFRTGDRLQLRLGASTIAPSYSTYSIQVR